MIGPMGELVGAVAALRRYPVKSMGGQDVAAAEVIERGVAGDRTHAVVDRETGKIGSAKNPLLWRNLLTMSARRDGEAVRITLPDGTEVAVDDHRIDALLSDIVGRPVRLVDRLPADGELERSEPLDVLARGLDADVPYETVRLDPTRTGSFVDFAPVHAITTATLDRIAELHPEHRSDVVRYRPNLVIRTLPGVAGFAENAWIGGTLSVGADLVLDVQVPTPRCAIPTLAHIGLPRDTHALRVLTDHNRLALPGGATMACAGAYLQVLHPGIIHPGDQVHLLPT